MAWNSVLVFLLVGPWWRQEVSSSLPYLEFKYHKYPELTEYLRHVNTTHPFITSLYSIGQTNRKRELWVLEVTAAPKSQAGVPNVKLVGNIHGNEPVGKEVMLHLIQFLISNYPSNETIAWMLTNTRIHFLPSMNPDGFLIADEGRCDGDTGRYSDRKYDLNRNFPDTFQKIIDAPQQETLAVIGWLNSTRFVLSAGLHGGALLADYPYDNLGPHPWVAALNLLNKSTEEPNMKEIWRKVDSETPDNTKRRQPSLTPDNDVFVHLASSYAKTHPTMHEGKRCTEKTRSFPGGITNGAEWFPTKGGMADYNYAFHGCLEITLELGCCKYPRKEELPLHWDQNKEALLEFINQAHRGVKGKVVDSVTNTPISGVLLKIEGRNNIFTTSDRGEFWRILLPGNYSLQVNAHGYHPLSVPFTVSTPEDPRRPSATWLDVRMSTGPPPTSKPPTLPSATTSTDDVTTPDDSTDTTNYDVSTTPLSHSTINLSEIQSVTVREALSTACQGRDATLVWLAISLFLVPCVINNVL